jgi:hypothetical protein
MNNTMDVFVSDGGAFALKNGGEEVFFKQPDTREFRELSWIFADPDGVTFFNPWKDLNIRPVQGHFVITGDILNNAEDDNKYHRDPNFPIDEFEFVPEPPNPNDPYSPGYQR